MNPHVVFDCQEALRNRFALVLAAAARARALNKGAEPRIALAAAASEVALHEIASGAFAAEELAPFLPGPAGLDRLPPPDHGEELDGGPARPAVPPAARHGQAIQ